MVRTDAGFDSIPRLIAVKLGPSLGTDFSVFICEAGTVIVPAVKLCGSVVNKHTLVMF